MKPLEGLNGSVEHDLSVGRERDAGGELARAGSCLPLGWSCRSHRMPSVLQIQIQGKKLLSAAIPTTAGKIFLSTWGASQGFCLIMPAFCLSRGVCSFPGLSTDGRRGCANTVAPALRGGCRA